MTPDYRQREIFVAVCGMAIWLSPLSDQVTYAQDKVIQSASASNRNPQKQVVAPLTLHYADPQTFPVGTAESLIIADFKCGTDGSVYVPIGAAEPVGPYDTGQFAAVRPSIDLVALRPSGTVVKFQPRAVDGYRNVMSLTRYAVTESYVYLLAMGDKVDPEDTHNFTGRTRFIQVFRPDGEFIRTLVLDPDEDPISFAVFGSGDLLLFDIDKLNHTTRLRVLDASGRHQKELSLFDDDFAGTLRLQNEKGNHLAIDETQRLRKVLSTANVTQRGNNLMLMSGQADLPLLELNEHGLLRSFTLSTPAGVIPSILLPSNDPLLHAVVGTLHRLSPPSEDGVFSDERQVFSPSEIEEFYPQDGSLAKRITIEKGPLPVCARGADYTFIVPRGQDKKIQVIRATVMP